MRLRLSILATLFLGTVVMAAAPDDDNAKQKKSDDAAKKSDAEKESPIQRLAELRVDEFVVPARMINLPLPGKTRTVQDLLDRFEKWSKDEKIGAVLLNVNTYTGAVASHELVDAVVYDLIYQVMKAPLGGAADVHSRPSPDGFHALQHLDIAGRVFVCGVFDSLGCHSVLLEVYTQPRCLVA